jgi:hypothetical protein
LILSFNEFYGFSNFEECCVGCWKSTSTNTIRILQLHFSNALATHHKVSGVIIGKCDSFVISRHISAGVSAVVTMKLWLMSTSCIVVVVVVVISPPAALKRRDRRLHPQEDAVTSLKIECA